MALKYSKEDIYNALMDKVSAEYNSAVNDDEKLLDLISKYNLFPEEEESSYYYDELNPKILIVGGLRVNKNEIFAIARREFNIPENNIDFVDYEDATNFNFNSLRGFSSYTDIIVGPMPHKVSGINGHSSLIAMLETEQDQFPKLTKAVESGEILKITKTSLRNALRNTRINLIFNGNRV